MNVIPFADLHTTSRTVTPAVAGTIVYLPVAPQITAKTRFSSSIPSRLDFIMPEEALVVLDRAMDNHGDTITMAAIAGPGDPLAVPDTTIKMVEMVKKRYEHLEIGLKTLGIGSERFSADLAKAGVTYVEMEVNGVKASVLEKLYAWIRPGQKTLKIGDAVELLLREQKNGVPALRYDGIRVCISTTLFPGYNVEHLRSIGTVMMELGADGMALIAYEPESGAEVVLGKLDPEEFSNACRVAGEYLPLVEPLLSYGPKKTDQADMKAATRPGPTKERPNIAVASADGMEINLHLGQADKIMIYGPRQDGLACLVDLRKAPAAGSGADRWQRLADVLHDCFAILVSQAGDAPRRVLGECGVRVVLVDGSIDSIVDQFYDTKAKGKSKRKGMGN